MNDTTTSIQNEQLWAAARQLVKDMNPHEATRFDRFAPYWPYWPGWAQRDVELAYLALRKAREL